MLKHRRGSRARVSVALVLSGLLATTMVALAPPASAAIVLGAAINFPSTLTVGDTDVAASIDLRNANTTPNASDTNTVCEPGDSLPCRGSNINIVPSCWVDATSSCDTGTYEPGVFRLSSTAVGDPATACAGMLFDTAETSPITGGYRFTPRGGAHVTLPGAGSFCRIGFTVDVLRVPTRDQDPATPGVQTTQILNHAQSNGAFLKQTPQFRSLVTVQPATPTISTTASPDITLGSGSITDTATVSGRVDPQAGATVEFRLYGPGDTTCTDTPAFTSTVSQPTTDGPVTSADFTPTAPGVYRWIAHYSGDTDNALVSGACNDTGEDVDVLGTVAPPVAAPSTTAAGFNPARTVVRSTRTTVDITVRSGSNPATGGEARVSVDGVLRGSGHVVDGRATVRLPVFSTVGRRAVLVEYSGVPGTTQASSTQLGLGVVKARPRLHLRVRPRTVHRVRTRAFLSISVTAMGQTVAGDVKIRVKGHPYGRVHLVRGKGEVRLPRYFTRGRKSVQAKYLGTRITTQAHTGQTFRVVRRR